MPQLFSDLAMLFAITVLLAVADLAMTTGLFKAKRAWVRLMQQHD